MELKNNSYKIQGLKLTDIAHQFGTPVYVYDAEKIVNQLQNLKNAFSNQNVKIKYAAKALTNISVLKLMKKHGAGVDVVSAQESDIALKAGFDPRDILFTPNCISFEEIVESVEKGLMINIDNISILEQFGHKYIPRVKPCL
ncbi:MAG: diaminopimelate decarboxylase, partial [Bacteroidota bacterium]